MLRKSAFFFLVLILVLLFAQYVWAESIYDEIMVGDHVHLGIMEQDGNPNNGKEPISWLVIDVNETYCLLITDSIIDHIPYSTSADTGTNWSNSDIRAWLNTELYSTIFSESEQEVIVPAQIGEDSKYVNNYTTTDFVFLFSRDEAEKYLLNSQVKVIPAAQVDYSPEKDAYHREDWWLRTSYNNGKAATVSTLGKACEMWESHGVRPVVMVLKTAIRLRPFTLPERDECKYIILRLVNGSASKECLYKLHYLTEKYFSEHYDIAVRKKIKRSSHFTYTLVNSTTGESISFDDKPNSFTPESYLSRILSSSDIDYMSKENGFEKIDMSTAVNGFFN